MLLGKLISFATTFLSLSGATVTAVALIVMSKPVDKYYICDRLKCEHCVRDCKYTKDETHALYKDHEVFIPTTYGLYEQPRKQSKPTP